MAMSNELMIAWLKKHEGFNSHPYMDSVGKVTIGFGRNLDDVGISYDEAETLLLNDLQRAKDDLQGFSWYPTLPHNVKDALINMMFNLGLTRFLTFKRMISALEDRDFTRAAIEALDSKWAIQVGNRAKDIALMIRQDI